MSKTGKFNWSLFSILFPSVWWKAGIFGKHKAEPPAAQLARGVHQSGCDGDGVLEALRAVAGHSGRRQLCGLLQWED